MCPCRCRPSQYRMTGGTRGKRRHLGTARWLSTTLCRCMYWPVRMVALAGGTERRGDEGILHVRPFTGHAVEVHVSMNSGRPGESRGNRTGDHAQDQHDILNGFVRRQPFAAAEWRRAGRVGRGEHAGIGSTSAWAYPTGNARAANPELVGCGVACASHLVGCRACQAGRRTWLNWKD